MVKHRRKVRNRWLAKFETKGGPEKTQRGVPGRRSEEQSDSDPASYWNPSLLHRHNSGEETNVWTTGIFLWFPLPHKAVVQPTGTGCSASETTAQPSNTQFENPLIPGVARGTRIPVLTTDKKTEFQSLLLEKAKIEKGWQREKKWCFCSIGFGLIMHLQLFNKRSKDLGDLLDSCSRDDLGNFLQTCIKKITTAN